MDATKKKMRWVFGRILGLVLASLVLASVRLSFVYDATNNLGENVFQKHEQHAATTTTRSTMKSKDSATNTDEETAANKKKEPMNIVLLYADDWNFRTLGSVGGYAKTPRLDEIAAQGILFTHNCVVTSVCMQSRATLYTGQYSSRHQTFFSWRNVTMYEGDRWKYTLYPLMHAAGYYNGFFGKYHHHDPPKHIPTFSKFDFTKMAHYVKRLGTTKHITEWNEEDGIRFLENRPKSKPFFLTLSFFATHAEDGLQERYFPQNRSMSLYVDEPVPIPKTMTDKHRAMLPPFFDERNFGRGRYRGRYDTPELYQKMMKNTYRMATEVDTTCGRIWDKLRDQGLLNNTLVIFTTDNGNMHGEHQLAEKWYPFEESVRVPLVIYDPRVPASQRGQRREEFTLNLDLAPTILSAAHVPIPKRMQGRDMSDLYLQQQEEWREEFLYEFWDDNPDIPNSLALVQKGFKFIHWTEHNYTQVFDLANDPFEEKDLYVATSKEQLQKYHQQIVEMHAAAKRGARQ